MVSATIWHEHYASILKKLLFDLKMSLNINVSNRHSCEQNLQLFIHVQFFLTFFPPTASFYNVSLSVCIFICFSVCMLFQKSKHMPTYCICSRQIFNFISTIYDCILSRNYIQQPQS